MFESFMALLARMLVALLLLTGPGAAQAGPVYRVSVDTSAWSGSGYLDLTLTGLEKILPVTATLSNFTGDFGSTAFTQGQVSGDIVSGVNLVQGPSFNELLQAIALGGMFSFDLRFDMPSGVLDGANFGVALVNAAQTAYLDGTQGDVASILLMPSAPAGLWAEAGIASIVEVPEPGGVALFALGLLLVQRARARRRSA